MEIEPSLHASRAKTPTPNGLRQRQLQRSTSRREHIKRESKIKSNHDEALNGHQSVSGSKSPVLAKIQTQRLPSIGRDNIAAPRKSNSLRRQQEGEHSSNIAVNVAPETISTGREGRQFTVANVGNNGKIFLRYAKLVLRMLLYDTYHDGAHDTDMFPVQRGGAWNRKHRSHLLSFLCHRPRP